MKKLMLIIATMMFSFNLMAQEIQEISKEEWRNMRIEVSGVSSGHVSMIINISADGNATATLSDTWRKANVQGKDCTCW